MAVVFWNRSLPLLKSDWRDWRFKVDFSPTRTDQWPPNLPRQRRTVFGHSRPFYGGECIGDNRDIDNK
jgi:hypothetical protein